ncbi:GntR family transcriptional regulator [Paeniglutamicibacter psychrophenolicus]|uniref:GntR family transcriptional regulator n=1 Tax=Paeniglutamicibacter psychrophenolicus TaxID=257454 RepID=UPI00277FA8DC|nr:GntR family transcriptional regulator [Paeniglutamicibacter psychrophenolicus]MDQ0092874.1 DNA-binding GntR family transcriptional regulator [Paeniglutamicibacter psychrophenolicus]
MTKADDAYVLLAEMIEVGRLSPGDFHTESGLVEELGIGRTPLREAVQRLDRDRLVRIRPGRGIEIPTNSVEDQLRRLEVRRAVEPLAVALACERATPGELAAVGVLADELVEINGLEAYVAAVRDTHRLLCEAAHNEYLSDTMTPLQGLSRKFWLAHVLDPEAEVGAGKELHLALLRHMVARDAEAAATASIRLNDYLVEFALGVATRKARVGRRAAAAY